ncbi:hypothetical protein B0F90DRAFT_1670073 [Multifurca ochricompacta]|uniref:Uncharacterized protein n=1 Tax=Multifurca ochricompacta TaxID=376703 RepID=A0AAD4QL20_9AGAM|nr:hypothetical protein B0F90DRAFT_1670073 [Multifurca ochricompacta]
MNSRQHLHQSTLLIDGYLAQMLGSRAAEAYHALMVGRSAALIQSYTDERWPGCFLAAPPYGPDVDPYNPPPPLVVDIVINEIGTVVKQKVWTPQNPSEVQRYVRELFPPIFFFKQDGSLGLSLIHAAAGDCTSLRDASSVAPVGTSAHAQIRINWFGYAPWDRQIMIRSPTRGTIPLEKFAKYVAGKVKLFMEETANTPYHDQSGSTRWFIGDGGISPRNVILIGAIHVSQGSWMPILQLNRFII